MKAKITWFLVVITVVSLILIGCSSSPTSTVPATSTPPSTTAQKTTPAAVPASMTSPALPTSTSTSQLLPIRIGHIRPLTGNLAISSAMMVKAFDFAFEQVNYQVSGRQIQIVIGDSKGDTATALDVARKMVENDKVSFIVGPTQAGEGPAVAGYANQVGIPQIFTSPQPLAIFSGANKWSFGNDGTNSQYSSCIGAYAFEQAGYKKIDVLTQDSAAGHQFLDAFMKTFKAKGGQVIQETYTPLPTQDFAPYMTVLKDADALVAWTAGADVTRMLSQYHELGIDKRLRLVGAFDGSFMSNATLSSLPPEDANALIGALLPTPYSPFLDTPFNKKWMADIQAKFGLLPDDIQSGPYEGAQLIMEALKATNGDTTPDKLRQALLAAKFDGPEGTIQFNQMPVAAIKTVYICKVVRSGKDFAWQPVFYFKDVPPAGL